MNWNIDRLYLHHTFLHNSIIVKIKETITTTLKIMTYILLDYLNTL